jgi:predicted MPP superfamily phosphohydrolase
MGILPPEKSQASQTARRRRSTGLNLGELKPLNPPVNTKSFSGYRDTEPKSKKKDEDAMDSDADDEDENKIKVDEADDDKYDVGKGLLSPEDARRQGELAEGVRKIKVSALFPSHISYICLPSIFLAKTRPLHRPTRPHLLSKPRQRLRKPHIWHPAPQHHRRRFRIH